MSAEQQHNHHCCRTSPPVGGVGVWVGVEIRGCILFV